MRKRFLRVCMPVTLIKRMDLNHYGPVACRVVAVGEDGVILTTGHSTEFVGNEQIRTRLYADHDAAGTKITSLNNEIREQQMRSL